MSEVGVMEWVVDNLSSPVLDLLSLAVNYAFLRDALCFIVAFILIAYRPTRRIGCVVLFASILMAVSVECIKDAVCRDRPFIDHQFALIMDPPNGYSFPSGHSACAALLATLYILIRRRHCVPMAVAVFFVCFTRVYLCVHYPTDTVAGVVIGILCACIAYRLLYRRLSGTV